MVCVASWHNIIFNERPFMKIDTKSCFYYVASTMYQRIGRLIECRWICVSGSTPQTQIDININVLALITRRWITTQSWNTAATQDWQAYDQTHQHQLHPKMEVIKHIHGAFAPNFNCIYQSLGQSSTSTRIMTPPLITWCMESPLHLNLFAS